MRANRELVLSALAIVIIGAAYAVVVLTFGDQPASSLIGHSLGIIGFLMMLMTETLYSLRKRSKRAHFGRMSAWLQFHIFTGIVGPFMVLLHTSWRFQGLAGVVTWMTVVVVASGFVGRYIYTAVPRGMGGAVLAAEVIEQQLKEAELQLQRVSPELRAVIFRDDARPSGAGRLIFGRGLERWRNRRRILRLTRSMSVNLRVDPREIEKLMQKRADLLRQARSLQAARRLLAIWHGVHIPLGMALFASAFVHIAAALYYATLLR